MGLQSAIELYSGPDRRLKWFRCALWLAALVVFLLNADRMPVVIILPVLLMLAYSWPGIQRQQNTMQHIVLYPDGKAMDQQGEGSWSREIWSSPWYSVIRFRSRNRTRLYWICASCNTADDYRRLRVWCRFSPQQEDLQVRPS